jgi:hypothetical protein
MRGTNSDRLQNGGYSVGASAQEKTLEMFEVAPVVWTVSTNS